MTDTFIYHVEPMNNSSNLIHIIVTIVFAIIMVQHQMLLRKLNIVQPQSREE